MSTKKTKIEHALEQLLTAVNESDDTTFEPVVPTRKLSRASNIESCSYTGVRLPVSIKQQLRNAAFETNHTLSSLIIRILSAYLLERSEGNDRLIK